jgi:hypothetical protein
VCTYLQTTKVLLKERAKAARIEAKRLAREQYLIDHEDDEDDGYDEPDPEPEDDDDEEEVCGFETELSLK